MLTPKEQQKVVRLEKELKMPSWKYVLIYGLSFGIFLSIGTSIIDVLGQKLPVKEIFKRRIWINLAMAPVAGIFFGYILRWFSIKEYQKLKAKERLP